MLGFHLPYWSNREVFMREVTTLFWDVGGVILSNGWDHDERTAAIQAFRARRGEFRGAAFASRRRHLRGARMSLDAYLKQRSSTCPRSLRQEEFKAFFFAHSTENTERGPLLDELTAAGRYLLVTLNNESAELNAYRIRRFQLTRNFTGVSSLPAIWGAQTGRRDLPPGAGY